MMNRQIKARRPQTIVEYVLIIAIVVVAAIGILSVFSDTVRGKIAGIVKVFSPNTDTSEADTSSKSIMQGLDKNGLSGSGSSSSGG
jgi:Flp pilus assembly pilin Flp